MARTNCTCETDQGITFICFFYHFCRKYERSKEFAMQLQERLDLISEEKAKIDELLKRQESRYEKMKQHALHQLE